VLLIPVVPAARQPVSQGEYHGRHVRRRWRKRQNTLARSHVVAGGASSDAPARGLEFWPEPACSLARERPTLVRRSAHGGRRSWTVASMLG